MVINSNSIHGLVTQLCDKLWRAQTPTYPLERRSSNVVLKDLRTLSYGILLNKSSTSCNDTEERWDAVSEILSYAYQLHQRHLTLQAIKVQELTDSLQNAGWTDNPVIESILLLLANLAGEVPDNVQETNVRNLRKSVHLHMLKIPLELQVMPYQEFPPQVFEPSFTLDIENNNVEFPFNQEPGTGLTVLGKFCSSASEKLRQRSLLEFPSFPELRKPRDLAIPKESPSQEQQDEGYVSPSQDNSMTVSCVNCTAETPGSEVWDLALTTEFPQLQTWETFGMLGPPNERPFLTESEVDCVQKIWLVMMGQMEMYRNRSLAGSRLVANISRQQLIRDLKFLLIGVPSQTFQYNQEEDSFVMKSGIYVDGVTPSTLSLFCQDFLISGTCCMRLERLIQRNVITGNYVQEGLMFQALCGSVRRYLQFYRAAVMMLTERPMLTHMRQHVDSLLFQMTCLGHLYKVHPDTKKDDVTLPEGVALLAYLYQEICNVTRNDVACILYSALQACCQVYFNFLQKWMFEGLCQDAYTEFFIQEQPDLMMCRQRDYWSRGYYMLEEAVPGFLRGMEGAIFQCGKALNLLKLCNPRDTLCVVLQSGYPTMRCCLHSADLQDLEAECLSYQKRAEALCGKTVGVSHFFQSRKEEERAFQVAVQVAQQESLHRIKVEHEMKLSQALSKKREQLAVLKEQMEMAEARKVDEKKRQMEEDEQHAREAKALEEETARQTEVEKAKLVRYYSTLSESAEKRRQHAEWRMDRMKLQEKRLDFQQEDLESAATMRSPNNNEDIQDINRNLADTNSSQNNLHLENNQNNILNNTNLVNNIENTTEENRNDSNNQNIGEADNRSTPTFHSISETESRSSLQGHDVKRTDSEHKEICLTPYSSGVNQPLESVPSPVKKRSGVSLRPEEQQVTGDTKEKKSRNVLTEAQRNWKRVMSSEYNILTGEEWDAKPDPSNNTHAEVVENSESSHSILSTGSPAEESGNTESNTSFETASMGSECPSVDHQKTTRSAERSDPKTVASVGSEQQILDVTAEDVSEERSKDSLSSEEPKHEDSESQNVAVIEVSENQDKEFQIVTNIGKLDDKNTDLQNDTMVYGVTRSRLSLSTLGTQHKFRYNLEMRLENAPLVDITDKVIEPKKNAVEPAVVNVGTTDMSSINIALQKSILIPLQIQTSLVNSALLKLFFEDQELLSHLHSLRSYFFLLDGEFGRNVTGLLFERMYQVSRPVDLLNCVALNSILNKALTRPDPNVDRLSFDVKYIPPHFSFSSPLLLDCIALQYKVSWPLNIILTEAALHKYDDVFGFLLRLRRISWVLEEDFHRLKRGAEDRTGLICSPQYHHVQLYRHEMTHFVRALQNYVTATVLQTSWVEFLQNLQNAQTLDDLYRTHVAYVKMVLFRCLLNKQSSSIQKALLDTLRMILKFHGQLRSQAWQRKPGTSHYQHPKFTTLVQIYNCFHNLAVFTFKFATKLANTGYQPHLFDLLQMLNMNGFYPEHF
ncbi:gamma-tubulin complex component 6 [Periplaneta americana]|uniref:gamma-tubulin complex component 6 n=1 Tax=Periplaneta americana TaxID=6978 RepID=UPI0037E735C2